MHVGHSICLIFCQWAVVLFARQYLEWLSLYAHYSFFFYATGLMRYNNLFSFSLLVKGTGKNANITLNWQLPLNYGVEIILETNICRRIIKPFLVWMYLIQRCKHIFIWLFKNIILMAMFWVPKLHLTHFIKDTLRQILLVYYLW